MGEKRGLNRLWWEEQFFSLYGNDRKIVSRLAVVTLLHPLSRIDIGIFRFMYLNVRYTFRKLKRIIVRNFELTASNAFGRRAAIVEDPALVEAQLQELHPDLKVILFKDAVRGGLGGRNEVTRASAPTAAGVKQWLQTVEDLRTLLAALQWHIHEQQNCPFISSPDRSTSIVVMTGNSETGKNGFEDPTNQAEKGAVAESFVHQNSQLELFNRGSFKLAKERHKETQVWALLYHYDKVLNEVRFELSLPTGFDNKKITEWGVRLILGSIPNNPADFTIRKDEPNAPATVEVEPKTGTF